MRGEARVTELAHPFAISLNAVSKHIRVLERAHVVRRRRAGREHLLAIDPESLDEAASWIVAQRAIWTKSLDTLESILRAEDHRTAKTRGEIHLDERRAGKMGRQTKARSR
jgi:DNA-binding transcriptional ArsR family regulator